MTVNAAPHPSPHRDRVRLAVVWLSFVTGPLVWVLAMMIGYGFSSYACYPASERFTSPVSELSWVPGFATALYGVAIVLTVIAGAVAWRTWTITRAEAAGHPLEIGEGRSRFLGLWGVITSAVFAGLLAFDLINTLLVPPCAG